MNIKLGQLKRLTLKSVWKHEEHDFNQIADEVLPQLERDKEAIEKEIGEKLQWNPTPEKRDKIIGLFRKIDISNRESWPEYCDWLVNYVARFRDTFRPRVRNIVVSELTVAHE